MKNILKLIVASFVISVSIVFAHSVLLSDVASLEDQNFYVEGEDDDNLPNTDNVTSDT